MSYLNNLPISFLNTYIITISHNENERWCRIRVSRSTLSTYTAGCDNNFTIPIYYIAIGF